MTCPSLPQIIKPCCSVPTLKAATCTVHLKIRETALCICYCRMMSTPMDTPYGSTLEWRPSRLPPINSLLSTSPNKFGFRVNFPYLPIAPKIINIKGLLGFVPASPGSSIVKARKGFGVFILSISFNWDKRYTFRYVLLIPIRSCFGWWSKSATLLTKLLVFQLKLLVKLSWETIFLAWSFHRRKSLLKIVS